MKFHIDLARYRAILAKQGGAFPDAMRMMESARVVMEPVTIEMIEDWNLSAENQIVPAITAAATYQQTTINSNLQLIS